MARSETVQAIVLKSYDVGEADRFCVLLTRERGRLAARARGVRKLKSRMGGSLLPCAHLSVTLSESSSGFYITSVNVQSDALSHNTMSGFLRTQQAMELLLALLHDEEEMPEVFDLLTEYLRKEHASSLCFTIRLLHLLGVLPIEGSDAFATLTQEEQLFIRAAIQGEWPLEPITHTLNSLCERSIQQQTSTTLRSVAIAPLLR